MHKPAWEMVLAIGISSLCSPALGTAIFKQTPIAIAGGTNVFAAAINKKGAIAGQYVGASGPGGFVLLGSTLTRLPASGQCGGAAAAYPSAINAAGDVAGGLQYPCNYAFLWHAGSYVQAGAFAMGVGGTRPTLNDVGVETYNAYDANGVYTAYAGKAGHVMAVPNAGTGMVLAGENTAGTLAGAAFGPVRGQGQPALFAGKAGHYHYAGLAGARACSGGYINTLGELAGTCLLSDGNWRAFRISKGRVDHILLPGIVHMASVGGINASGRVVGIYTNATSGLQRAFLFNGKEVSVFGQYGGGDIVHVTLNDAGTIVVADAALSGAVQSWRVVCKGKGC